MSPRCPSPASPSRPWRRLSLLVAPLLAVAPFTAAAAPQPAAAESAAAVAAAAPRLSVTTVVSGLTNPWDLTWVGDLMLFDERGGAVWSKRGSAAPRRVTISGFPSVYSVGEGGLLGMVADPAAATNRRFYTCVAVRRSDGGPLDVRVLRWRLTGDTTAVSDGAPVVTGIPLARSGRHSGCRLRFGGDGRLYVGTGDAAIGTTPQDLQSLGGKVLRVGWDGSIPADNPFVARGGNARYVWDYGHRNVQGLALRPGTSELFSVEHGTGRDDEMNWSVRGANYGWDPVPGYDESTPMTDVRKFPTARPALWSSGSPTVAPSGASFLVGPGWGGYRGWLAVGLLKDQGILLMRLQPSTTPVRVPQVVRLPQAQGFGRIRAVQTGPDGSLWFTTSNGGGEDRIVRINPSATPPPVPAGRLVSSSGVTAARTGSAITAFVRGTDDGVYLRRSTDDGRTWGPWTRGGVGTTGAPSAASSAARRVDLVTRDASGAVVHTWYVDGVRRGAAPLSGRVIAQHASSPGDGTLDVWAVAPDGAGWWRHWDRTRWSGWQQIGGRFTSGLSASADSATRQTLVTGRGTDGRTYTATFGPGSTGRLGDWRPQSDGLSGWSDRALGDRPHASGWILAAGVALDGTPVVQRGSSFTAVTGQYTSAPDVVSRPDGTFLMLGRGTNDGLWVFDARPGGFVNVHLGGVLR